MCTKHIITQQIANQEKRVGAQVCSCLYRPNVLSFTGKLTTWCLQDLAEELEKERTKCIIAQQTANQEKLQARASAAESASLRRQLNELAQQMEQEKKKAAAVKPQPMRAADSDKLYNDIILDRVSWCKPICM